MSEFREMLKEDFKDVFLNADEFADEHEIEGASVTCVIQERDASSGKDLLGETGTGSSGIVVYAETEKLPARRMAGDRISVDGVDYIIDLWSDEGGLGMSRLKLSVPMPY